MASLIQHTNRMLTIAGLEIVPRWRLLLPEFEFRGDTLKCFCHSHNCGFPPRRMTERSVELPVADRWLSSVPIDNVTEVGAVTPYYWPARVRTVIDPYDTSAGVTERASMFECDLRGRDVLAISTIEHIGLGEYGPSVEGESVISAWHKILNEARSFFVTVPYGYNPVADDLLFATPPPEDVRRTFLVRSSRSNVWRQVLEPSPDWTPYGGVRTSDHAWANVVAFLERAPTSG